MIEQALRARQEVSLGFSGLETSGDQEIFKHQHQQRRGWLSQEPATLSRRRKRVVRERNRREKQQAQEELEKILEEGS